LRWVGFDGGGGGGGGDDGGEGRRRSACSGRLGSVWAVVSLVGIGGSGLCIGAVPVLM